MNTMTPATKKTRNARDKAQRAAETSSQRETRRAKRCARDRSKARRVAETSSERETRRAKRRVRDIAPQRACKRATLASSRLRATSVGWKVPGWCDDAFAPAMRLFCDGCFAWPFFSEATLLAHYELNPCGATRTRSTNVPLTKSTSTTLKPLEFTLVSHCDVCKCPWKCFGSQMRPSRMWKRFERASNSSKGRMRAEL